VTGTPDASGDAPRADPAGIVERAAAWDAASVAFRLTAGDR
jgi:hypothetical protein